MRGYKDSTGAVFDVQEDKAERFLETFTYIQSERRGVDFEVEKCKALPELREDDRGAQGQGSGYQRGGGYGSQGYGSRGGGYGS